MVASDLDKLVGLENANFTEYSMNRILFDIVATQPLGGNKRHGGGKYGEIILYRMIERNIPIVCYYDSKRWLNPTTFEKLKINHIKLYDLNKDSLCEIVKSENINVIYSALPQRKLFLFKDCKVIGTIHGLRTLETPADFHCLRYRSTSVKGLVICITKKLFSAFYKNLLCKYKLKQWSNPQVSLVTVSKHSENSIRSYFPEMKNRDLRVFYSPSTSSNVVLGRKFHEKYFMMVSGAISYKNNLRAIMALDMLFSNGYISDFKVKLTGVKDASAYRYKIKNTGRFEFLGYVDENELEQLYHDAYALIYPSLNEGFGYPPLEAMHYGVPVLSSPFASITEVCEGAAIYFNPFSIEEIASRILYISQEEVCKEYTSRSLAQFAKVLEKQQLDLDRLIDFICDK